MSAFDFVTGIQHIGIPTNDMDATVRFFKVLGFDIDYETENNGRVVFLKAGSIVIETYEKNGEAAEKRGAIDHIALNVEDLDGVLEEIRKTEYPVIEGPNYLPFYHGVRYFSVLGPNKEVVEFNQKL